MASRQPVPREIRNELEENWKFHIEVKEIFKSLSDKFNAEPGINGDFARFLEVLQPEQMVRKMQKREFACEVLPYSIPENPESRAFRIELCNSLSYLQTFETFQKIERELFTYKWQVEKFAEKNQKESHAIRKSKKIYDEKYQNWIRRNLDARLILGKIGKKNRELLKISQSNLDMWEEQLVTAGKAKENTKKKCEYFKKCVEICVKKVTTMKNMFDDLEAQQKEIETFENVVDLPVFHRLVFDTIQELRAKIMELAEHWKNTSEMEENYYLLTACAFLEMEMSKNCRMGDIATAIHSSHMKEIKTAKMIQKVKICTGKWGGIHRKMGEVERTVKKLNQELDDFKMSDTVFEPSYSGSSGRGRE